MRGHHRALAALAWAALVVACSTGVWAVIRTAGEDVTTAPTLPRTTPGVVGVPAPSARPTGHPSRRPTGRPTPSTATTSAGPTPGSASAATPGSTASSSPRAVPPRAGTTEADAAGGSTSGSSGEVRRTWQGDAGAVVASCRGGTIALRGAQANAGWRVEVRERGPEELAVRFDRSEDEVEVQAKCGGGQPRFEVSGEESEDD